MGLAAELSYVHPRPNLPQRTVKMLASTRAGSWVFSKTLARLDRTVTERTHGRLSVPRLLAGLPILVLTTTGRRTGRPRETQLVAIPFGNTLALLGTNFGQPKTPAWVFNLEADARASIAYEGRRREVVARPASATEHAQVLAASADIYGGYLKYQQRISGRRVRVFVLEPTQPG